MHTVLYAGRTQEGYIGIYTPNCQNWT